MSFLRHEEIYRVDDRLPAQAPERTRNCPPRPHRLDEFPAGYSSAGWSPPEPASASPAAGYCALHSVCQSRIFHRTANSLLSLRLSFGAHPRPRKPNEYFLDYVCDIHALLLTVDCDRTGNLYYPQQVERMRQVAGKRSWERISPRSILHKQIRCPRKLFCRSTLLSVNFAIEHVKIVRIVRGNLVPFTHLPITTIFIYIVKGNIVIPRTRLAACLSIMVLNQNKTLI